VTWPVLRGFLADPPLDPGSDEARSWLRRELLRPEYNDQNLVQRLLARIERLLNNGIDAASGASALQTITGMVLLVLLAVAFGWLISRTQRGSARARAGDGAVLTDEGVTAAELRRRADAALAEGRHADALVDGFRALALRQMERGRIEDIPGATAHEVALALESTYPGHRERVDVSAGRFDSVLYGDRPATADQARDVLTLDDELGASR
jgi:hypothetical protein